MGSVLGRILIALLFTGALGCTKANPGFDVFDPNAIPQPLFNGATSTKLSTASATSTQTIQGECDFKITAIDAQVVGQATTATAGALSRVAATSPLVNCQSTGKFTFELKSLSGLGITPVQGETYEVQLRGETSAGISKPSSIFIVYSIPTPDNRSIHITSGGTESTTGLRQTASTTFKAEIRVGHMTPAYTDPSVQDAMTTRSSAHFQIK